MFPDRAVLNNLSISSFEVFFLFRDTKDGVEWVSTNSC